MSEQYKTKKKARKRKNVESESENPPKKTTQITTQKRKKIESESSPEETAQKTSQKQKNVERESASKKTIQITSQERKKIESESSPEETAQKTLQKQKNVERESASKKTTQITSQERKKIESESESSSAPLRRSERIARQDSDLASAIRDLGLSSSLSFNYKLPSSASGFKTRHMELLKVTFRGASAENIVIPDVEVVNFPSDYVLTGINRHLLRSPDFDVDKLEGISDGDVLTFIDKLHDITENSTQLIGTSETHTDSLVDDLLRIARLNTWPLKIKNHEPCAIYIDDEPAVSSDPEFVIKKRSIFVLVDKHLKNIGYATGFGESQIAVEILACGSENIRLGETPTDQTLWAIRVISTYVTFYKAIIPATYWMELANGLPEEQKVEIERWPVGNGLKTGFDLAEPAGRRTVLTALTKIRESLLKPTASSTPRPGGAE